MGFLVPAFLAGAAAAAVPIVLHLLRHETAPAVPFSAVRLLAPAPEERLARRRLREWLLLALRLVAIVALALAFARPYWTGGAGPTGTTIVAVDTSFSFSAPGRFDRARALAEGAIDAADPGHAVGVVAFSDRAELVAEPSLDRTTARAAVGRLEPGYGATRYRAALERAVVALGGRPGRIVVVTDLQRAGWEPGERADVPEDVEVRIADTGGVPSNVAVTALTLDGDRAVAVVEGTGAVPPRARVTLVADGKLVGERDVAVDPGTPARVVFDRLPAAAERFAVRVEDASGYAADDTRYAVREGTRPPRVVVVTSTGSEDGDAFYLTRALRAADPPRAVEVAVVGGRAFAAAPAETLASSAAVVLLSTRDLDRRALDALAAHVSSGRAGLLVAGGDHVSPTVVSTLTGAATPARVLADRPEAAVGLVFVDLRHPIAAGLGPLSARLAQVRVARRLVWDGPTWRVIARFTDGTPALVERALGDGRILWFGSDLGGRWNELPRDPAFVPVVHEAVRYVAGARTARTTYVLSEVPAGIPKRPGVVAVGSPPRRVAVNVDARESDPTRITVEEFGAAIRRVARADRRAIPPAVAAEMEAAQGSWRYLVGVVFLTLVVESWVSRR